MTTESIHKITAKSKQKKFQASKDYKQHGVSVMPYEELIVTNEKYPDFVFLVHKNMIFDRNSISDSSYDVYSFDKEGNYVREEKVVELGKEFFRTMKILKKL
jgi:hypothetical protein